MNLKEKLSKKLKKTGGFTLIEMLIVVAIIAILVAVSIPMVGTSLDNARRATDEANVRAAKTVAMLSAVEGKLNGEEGSTLADDTYFYDISEGKLSNVAGGPEEDDGPQASENKAKGDSIIVTFAGGVITAGPDWGTFS